MTDLNWKKKKPFAVAVTSRNAGHIDVTNSFKWWKYDFFSEKISNYRGLPSFRSIPNNFQRRANNHLTILHSGLHIRQSFSLRIIENMRNFVIRSRIFRTCMQRDIPNVQPCLDGNTDSLFPCRVMKMLFFPYKNADVSSCVIADVSPSIADLSN